MKPILFVAISLLLTGCIGMPEGMKPVENFELQRYLGKWYEIARLDHSFERGLEKISAEYTLRTDGGVNVVNRGFSIKEQQWESANGRAYFVDRSDLGHLKVSFFRPFYSSYVIFGLEENNYDYAFVSGPNHSYLWLLARSPTVPDSVLASFKTRASEHGFDMSKLIYVNQNTIGNPAP